MCLCTLLKLMHFFLQVVFAFNVFGDSSLPVEQYHKLLAEAMSFILACYRLSKCESLNAARVMAWQTKMRRHTLEPPLLPTAYGSSIQGECST